MSVNIWTILSSITWSIVTATGTQVIIPSLEDVYSNVRSLKVCLEIISCLLVVLVGFV